MPQLSTCSCITVQVDIQYYLAILQYCCNYNTAYYLTVLYTVHNTKQLEIVETVFFFPSALKFYNITQEELQHPRMCVGNLEIRTRDGGHISLIVSFEL